MQEEIEKKTIALAISGTHMAHSNFRAMPICLAIGAAGGSAAALSAKENKKLRDIEPQKIQQLLS